MAAKKKGRVIRVSEEAFRFLSRKSENLRASVDETIQEMIDVRARLEMIEAQPVLWALPSVGRLFRSKAKAKGEALLAAVRAGREEAEEPKQVREVV